MTIDQQRASDPAQSVWVAASAGTGKTKVLTDRVLRLLLQGVPPPKILCITYTNAAAAEMEERIEAQLGAWAVMPDKALQRTLEKLTLKMPSEADMVRARVLLLQVLDAPQRVRIQTIHGFCQSVLKRFPLEAGVAPHFTLIDERTAAELVEKAKYALFTQHNTQCRQTIAALATVMAEKTFDDLMHTIVQQRGKFLVCLQQSEDAIYAQLQSVLGCTEGDTHETLQQRHFVYTAEQENDLRKAAQVLAQTTEKTNTKIASGLQQWLEKSITAEEYCFVFMTQEREPSKRLVTASAKKVWPDIEGVLRAEQQRVVIFHNANQSLYVLKYTLHMLRLARALLAHYQLLKAQHGYLDYEDLIVQTLQLFSQKEAAPWVLYKLDGGIDHLLLDEAQDTSPQQWQLLDFLVGEFFAGQGAGRTDRTVFVVGDEKQSIYSFQGANPHYFGQMQQAWSRRLERAKAEFARVRLSLSFRSTQAVLQVVDAVFAQVHAQEGLIFSEKDISHQAHRAGLAGRVELWPLFSVPEREATEPWMIATASSYTEAPYLQCANKIADTIASWLKQKRILPLRGRPVQQGDILILMQKRGQFARTILKALKQRGIAVAGADRLVVTQHLAVMDLMALGDFLLLPQDDLTLATLLKSPLIGLMEEDIFTLAYGREEKSLWKRLCEKDAYKPVADFLRSLLAKVDFLPPYELFMYILEECGGYKRIVARLGADSEEPLDEFLSLALQYEADSPPSLQGFLHWMRSGNTQIKRDMEKDNNEVRVMTVHGAKGLQAPIVFLADAATVPKPEGNTVLWANEESLPLWVPTSDYDDAVITASKAAILQERKCEYRRLLYVAMTRAEDELYITGWHGKRKPEEYCWYELIHSAFESPELGAVHDGENYVLSNGEPTKQLEKTTQYVLPDEALPAWIIQPAAQEIHTVKPLAPSRMEDRENTLSPAGHAHARERGVLIHRLLQYLPEMSEVERAEAMLQYMQRYATAFSAEEQQSIMQEIQLILQHPDFAFLWKEGSLSEVPVSGIIEDENNNKVVISGQIDRLAVTEKVVYILDYKTNREAPEDILSVPQVYLKQMDAYRRLIEKIYPDKQVRCGLLWTSKPKLMELFCA